MSKIGKVHNAYSNIIRILLYRNNVTPSILPIFIYYFNLVINVITVPCQCDVCLIQSKDLFRNQYVADIDANKNDIFAEF